MISSFRDLSQCDNFVSLYVKHAGMNGLGFQKIGAGGANRQGGERVVESDLRCSEVGRKRAPRCHLGCATLTQSSRHVALLLRSLTCGRKQQHTANRQAFIVVCAKANPITETEQHCRNAFLASTRDSECHPGAARPRHQL